MALVTYVGPYDAVDVPDAGLVSVERGASVEVFDDLAASLLAQPENWAAGDQAAADLTSVPLEDQE